MNNFKIEEVNENVNINKDIEEYKENYVSFVEVMEHLKKGNSAKRKYWKGKIYFNTDFDYTDFEYFRYLIYEDDIYKKSIPLKIYTDDMYSKDWILL